MTPKELAELEAKARAATPGPWRVSDVFDTNGDCLVCETDDLDGAFVLADTVNSSPQRLGDWPDARYIAAVNPQVILNLIAYIYKLRRLVEISVDRGEEDETC